MFSYFGNTNDFRLQQIQHSTSSSNLSTFSYTYDADGQIATWTQQADAQTPTVWVTDLSGGGATRFKDSLNELGTVTVGGSAAPLDSRNTNFVGFATTTTGVSGLSFYNLGLKYWMRAWR